MLFTGSLQAVLVGVGVPGTPLLSWSGKGWCGAGKNWGAAVGWEMGYEG